jgi:hypothetical protein
MLIQVIINIVVFYRSRQKLLKAFVGFGVGLLICFIIFAILDYRKGKIKTSIETSMVIRYRTPYIS